MCVHKMSFCTCEMCNFRERWGGKKSAIFIFSHDRPVLSEIQQFSCRTLNNATLHLKVHIAATK